MTFRQLKEKMVYDNTDGKITIGGKEVSVVYFRTGYSPENYKTNDDWITREILEISRAIKCPNIATQLINFKKIQ